MDATKIINMVNEGIATLEDMYEFHEKKDVEFVVEKGVVTDVLHK